jgi:hypothetical protein
MPNIFGITFAISLITNTASYTLVDSSRPGTFSVASKQPQEMVIDTPAQSQRIYLKPPPLGEPAMAPRRGTKLLALSAFLAIVFFTACAILFALVTLGVVDLSSDSDGYAPSEMVLNCFDQHELWEPLCLSPDAKQLVAAGFRKLTWITNWDDRDRATTVVQDLDFGERVESATFSKDGAQFAVYVRAPTEDTIAVFDARNRQLLKKWPTSRSLYDIKIHFSDDGEVLFTDPVEPENKSEHLSAITVWEISTGKLHGSIRTPKESRLADFCFSQGRLLFAYEDQVDHKEITIYESERPYVHKKFVASIKAPDPTSFDSVRFSADGARILAVSNSGGSVTLWSVASAKECIRHSGSVNSKVCLAGRGEI